MRKGHLVLAHIFITGGSLQTQHGGSPLPHYSLSQNIWVATK